MGARRRPFEFDRFSQGHAPWEKHLSVCKCASAASARTNWNPLVQKARLLNEMDDMRLGKNTSRPASVRAQRVRAAGRIPSPERQRLSGEIRPPRERARGGYRKGCAAQRRGPCVSRGDAVPPRAFTDAAPGPGSPGSGPGSRTGSRCSRRSGGPRSSCPGPCCRTGGTSRSACRFPP